ncbi:MAG: ABC transporter ATP-binding protein [Cypionkella sp.]
MAALELRDVLKSYGKMQVIHGVSLDIEDGQFVALVGPSGCGKSTLLRMIAGLESITGGEVVIGGRVVNDEPPKNRDIAMVFQNYALYPHMTVARNMSVPLRLKRLPKAQINEMVLKAARILGLEQIMDRYPRQLSGGQRQRVAMGRAIVRDPIVFLFDEPLSNLDAKLRGQMRTEIKELHQRLNTTTVFVTHDQIEAMTLADKVVVMNAGRIEQIGSPLELYDFPDTLFVAAFIGSPSMNMIEGTVREGGKLEASDGLMLDLPKLDSLTVGGKVTLGFRPEHLRIDPAGIAAEVVVVEPTGSETQVSVRAGAHALIAVFHERVTLKSQQKVALLPDLSRALVFDTASGQRLV